MLVPLAWVGMEALPESGALIVSDPPCNASDDVEIGKRLRLKRRSDSGSLSRQSRNQTG
jgi:hypothetical protein